MYKTTRWTRRASAITALAAAGTLALGGVAFADNIQDSITATDAPVSLVAGSGVSGSATIRLVANSAAGDPDPGCNIDAGENPLKLDIVTPAGVTANPDPLSITSCGTDFPVSFTASSSAVSGHVTVTVLSGPAGGGTYVNQVDIPITVNHKPSVSISGVSDGDSYVTGHVPTATCDVTDAEDGPSSFAASLSSLPASGLGSQTATCDYTDQGGLKADTKTATYHIVAPPNTKPSVSISGVSDGDSYVTGHVPTATCDVTDAEDGPSSFAASLSSLPASGLGSQTATCDYTDQGGLKADTATATYTVTPPPNTKPSVALTGVSDGDSYEIGHVPTAGCDVTDTEDGPSSFDADLSGTLSHGLGTQTATCDYTDRGGLAADTKTATYTIVDTGDPTISHTVAGTQGDNGWYKTDVTVHFSCADSGSGVQSCTTDQQFGEGKDQSVTGTATDWAGNTATDVVSGINVDKTAPTVGFNGGPSATYYYGNDPAAPTCDGSDALSGLASCVVTGGGTAVGPHTYTATATDNAGNTATATLNYTVMPWTFKGFYQPVDMSGVWNTVKGGSTVPVKFNLFAGGTELTSTSAVKSFTQQQVTCPGASAVTDAIEITSTGGTSLRYDSTGGQFVQNWQTPKKPGTCQLITVTAQDGSSVSAKFMLK